MSTAALLTALGIAFGWSLNNFSELVHFDENLTPLNFVGAGLRDDVEDVKATGNVSILFVTSDNRSRMSLTFAI